MPELDLHFEKALYEVKASRKHFIFNIFCYLIETFVDRIPLVHGYYYGNIETETFADRTPLVHAYYYGNI